MADLAVRQRLRGGATLSHVDVAVAATLMPTDVLDPLLARQVTQFRDEICAAIRRRTGDVDLAEEVAQETLARVIARLQGEGLQDPDRIENFSYRVAANVLREHRRRSSREDPDSELLDGAASVSEEQFEHCSRSEECRAMWQALEHIGNDDYREILIRYYLRQEDKSTLCRELGISPRAFTQRLFRAKESLRRALAAATDGAR